MTCSQKVWLAGMFLAFAVFFIGIHSIDNAWNMRYVENRFGGDMQDCGMVNCFGTDQLYMQGLFLTMLGGYGLFLTALLFPEGRKDRPDKRA